MPSYYRKKNILFYLYEEKDSRMLSTSLVIKFNSVQESFSFGLLLRFSRPEGAKTAQLYSNFNWMLWQTSTAAAADL